MSELLFVYTLIDNYNIVRLTMAMPSSTCKRLSNMTLLHRFVKKHGVQTMCMTMIDFRSTAIQRDTVFGDFLHVIWIKPSTWLHEITVPIFWPPLLHIWWMTLHNIYACLFYPGRCGSLCNHSWMGTIHKSRGKLLHVHKNRYSVITSMAILGK